MTAEKLLKLMRPYMAQFETKSAPRKTKLAFKAWQEVETYKREKSEAAKKKAEEGLSPEGKERVARETSATELLNKKGSLDIGEKSSLREKLGIMQKPR